MRKIIINADDCGISKHVDSCIEEAIKQGLISSTTILANMDDFDGAVKLYKTYHDHISFGWHINLDEGASLTRSQVLLDKGIFIERDNQIYLNGSAFGRSFFNKEVRQAIKTELRSQWEKLSDNGIIISHVDGHHFIHTQPSMIQIMPSLFKELGINRCRHVSNYGHSGLSGLARSLWASYYKSRGMRMPDTFSSLADYYNDRFLPQGRTIELMCHPGHQNKKYQEEFALLRTIDFKEWEACLCTYYDV